MQIIQTGDGSHTLYLPELNETYHSRHGAFRESAYVFIEQGLQWRLAQEPVPSGIVIFEIGFGTGLNALLSLIFAEKHKIKTIYHSIEQYPIAVEVAKTLNYCSYLEDNNLQGIFEALHYCDWNTETAISGNFILHKILADFLSPAFSPPQCDIIFYDAFAPSKQEEMWQLPVLAKCVEALADGGALVTYCAKGQFKRDLKSLGLKVETLPGPPGKAEMVRAVKA
ncbi:MAG: tRNA (5-methylaminomethyl-2-thiouridine)(34)-methyltransferase MnmD [Cyclobacteriaceae bacterium]|nr:tRNA (5-methylaminomethyl-2-thiouridine)(34)-methyltransferase MnmD [Cyclobacteriaceae bacterium]